MPATTAFKPSQKTKADWEELIANLKRGAETDKDPSHRNWCAGQLTIVLRRFREVFGE